VQHQKNETSAYRSESFPSNWNRRTVWPRPLPSLWLFQSCRWPSHRIQVRLGEGPRPSVRYDSNAPWVGSWPTGCMKFYRFKYSDNFHHHDCIIFVENCDTGEPSASLFHKYVNKGWFCVIELYFTKLCWYLSAWFSFKLLQHFPLTLIGAT